MKGYVKFTDGHVEEILNGFEFDGAGYPNDRHYIVVGTRSGSYRKTINKKTGEETCYGFIPMPGYMHPVCRLGHNGITDIVVARMEKYNYRIHISPAITVSGTVEVAEGACLEDIRLVIFDQFMSTEIQKVEEEKE